MKKRFIMCVAIIGTMLSSTSVFASEFTTGTVIPMAVTPIYEVQQLDDSILSKPNKFYEVNADDLETIDASLLDEEDINMPEIRLNSLSRVNYNDVTLINDESKAFVNYDGSLWNIPANTQVQFYYVLPSNPGVYHEMGYIDENGNKTVVFDNEYEYSYVDCRITFTKATKVKFYIKNTQSDPFTVTGIKVNFPM